MFFDPFDKRRNTYEEKLVQNLNANHGEVICSTHMVSEVT